MPCYTPLKAYRIKSGALDYGITFDCNHPDIIFPLSLPCGQCIGCRLERSRQWAIRCVHEAQLHASNCFITLTFDDAHLPPNSSLDKTDFQLFMKRLRKKYPKNKNGHIGYFMCGEYGEKYERPHYHACLFNFDFPDKKLWKTTHNGDRLYTSEILQELWQFKGYGIIGDVTFDSAAYVARYITKKITGNSASAHYGNRLPEYTNCSKRPSIGLEWIKRYHNDVYSFDTVIHDGKKMRPSRYYDKFYEKNFPDKYENIKINREINSMPLNSSCENSLERVNVKHELQLLKQKQISRSYEIGDKISSDLSDRCKNHDQKIVDYYKQVIADLKKE